MVRKDFLIGILWHNKLSFIQYDVNQHPKLSIDWETISLEWVGLSSDQMEENKWKKEEEEEEIPTTNVIHSIPFIVRKLKLRMVPQENGEWK